MQQGRGGDDSPTPPGSEVEGPVIPIRLSARNSYDFDRGIARGVRGVNFGDYLVMGALAFEVEGENLFRAHRYGHILSRGEIRLYDTQVNPEYGAIAIGIANVIAPGPITMRPEEALIRAGREIIAFLKNDMVAYGDLVAITADVYHAMKGDTGLWSTIAWLPKEMPDIRGIDDFQHVTRSDLDLILAGLDAHATMALKMTTTKFYVCMILAVAKQGNLTRPKFNAVIREIERELGYNLGITPELITTVYRLNAPKVGHDIVKQLFEEWRKAMGTEALRLRITLMQAAGAGLTALNTIKQAMKVFPQFHWSRLGVLLPADCKGYVAACVAVGHDEYYGFHVDLGPACASHYRSLAYVAKELLIRHGGPDYSNLTNYQGWTNTPFCKALLDKMITSFDPTDLADTDDVDEELAAQMADCTARYAVEIPQI